MSRRTSSIPDPVTGKRTLHLPGVGYHAPTHRYRIQYRHAGKWCSDYFPVTPEGLRQAKARREELDHVPPRLIPAMTPKAAKAALTAVIEPYVDGDSLTPEQVEEWRAAGSLTDKRDVLVRLGVPAEVIESNLDMLDTRTTGYAINPEYLQLLPAEERHRATLEALGLPHSDGTAPAVKGLRLTVEQVGTLYRDWYLSRHADKQAAQALADTYNARIEVHNAEVREKRKERKAAGFSIPKNSRPFRIVPHRDFTYYLPRRVRQAYREHLRYYACFVSFIGGDKQVHELTGADFRSYFEHVHALKKKHSDRWVNHRFQAVSGALRRVKKIYPDAAWPIGLFGSDGLLSILEQRNNAKEGKKVLITPAEFKALLNVADVQWRALLLLSFNGALKNSDLCLPWSAIDFDRCLLTYPRPKNGRMRITPLLPATIEALKTWRRESKSQRAEVFVTKEGAPWIGSTDSLSKHFALLKKEVEEKTGHAIPATFDSLRKTPATVILSAGVPNAKEAIQFLLGHKPNEAWRYYVGMAPECLHSAVAALAPYFD